MWGVVTGSSSAAGGSASSMTSPWGYDVGDEVAHITTNISPPNVEYDVEFFYEVDFFRADEIEKIEDVEDWGRFLRQPRRLSDVREAHPDTDVLPNQKAFEPAAGIGRPKRRR